jgi:hypothetical protein
VGRTATGTPARTARQRRAGAAVALITNRLGASGAADADLIGDVPAETIIGALAAIAARAMSCAYPMPVVQQILRDLGVAVAREANGG